MYLFYFITLNFIFYSFSILQSMRIRLATIKNS